MLTLIILCFLLKSNRFLPANLFLQIYCLKYQGVIILKKKPNTDKDYHQYYSNIGLNISYYRRKNGLTQEALAERVGISRSFLSAIEAPNVDKVFSLPVLFEICSALEIEPSQIFNFNK